MPSSVKETPDIDVGGPASDELFKALDDSIGAKLPEQSGQGNEPRQRRPNSDVVSPDSFDGNTSQGASGRARNNTPCGILELLQSRHGVPDHGSVSAREHSTTTRTRHWPLASDFFKRLDGSGSPDYGAVSTTQHERFASQPAMTASALNEPAGNPPVLNEPVVNQPALDEPASKQPASKEPVTPPMMQNRFVSMVNEPPVNDQALDNHTVDLAVTPKSRSSFESTFKPESHIVRFQDPIPNPSRKHEQPSDALCAAIGIGRDAERTSDNQQVASQFLRGLVALIDGIRTEKTQPTRTPLPLTYPIHADTHTVDSIQAVRYSALQQPAIPVSVPAPVPSTLYSATHSGGNAQAITTSTNQAFASGQDTQDDQTRHLDALDAARQARVAMKDTFGDVMPADGTRAHQGSVHTSDNNRQRQGTPQPPHSAHLGVLGASWLATLDLTSTLDGGAPLSATQGTHRPATASTSYDAKMQDPYDALQDPELMPSIVPDGNSGVPYLLESMVGGKIKLYLNGMAMGCTHGRLLYQTGRKPTSLTQIGFKNPNAKIERGPYDIVIERNLQNYMLLVEAYHYLRLRKSELVKEWKRANRARTHLLVPHGYARANDEHEPPLRYKGCPMSFRLIQCTPSADLEPEAEQEASLISRRVLFQRAKNIRQNYTYSMERLPEHFGWPNSVKITKQKAIRNAFILPESEEVYSRLAWFVHTVSEETWLSEPNTMKRPSETALEAPGPSKKAKKALNNVQARGTKANSVALGPVRNSVLNQRPASEPASRHLVQQQVATFPDQKQSENLRQPLAPNQMAYLPDQRQENHGVLIATKDDWQAAHQKPSAETVVLKYSGMAVVLNEG
ncbi:hypothetical protein GE09DRAFT_1124731 [Coniochaeta sp. 2T2.1]|nr:hypothetical protein GE09DRAFT_1124731 [Coniochaeta sp. 2T2.1]